MSDLLDRVAANTFQEYDPAIVIAAVNALLPVGKEKVLAQITAYLSTTAPDRETSGLRWLLRVVFDAPLFPAVLLGRPSVPPPTDPAALPRFPIVIVDDVPLLLTRGYDLSGVPERIDDDVAFARDQAVLRRAPLTPSVANAESDLRRVWMDAYGATPRRDTLQFIRTQLDRLRRSGG